MVFTLTSSCGQTQNNSMEKEAEKILLEFYTKHFQVWRIPSLPSDVRYEKLDSLMQKYCTSKLRNEAREAFENVGVDFLTNDRIGDSNESLKVEKEAGNENGYIISFISDVALYSDAPGATTKKQIVLHVTVVKEGESYKIDSVK
jgi:hypothetical protein